MLIICEGPDAAGKSTLVSQLHDVITQRYPTWKVEVLHKGPPAPDAHPLDEYELPLLSYRPGREHVIICDRWHIGEWVYPFILKRKTHADRAVWYHIELFLQSRGAIIVHLGADPSEITRRLTERGDDLVYPHQATALVNGYANMRQHHTVNSIYATLGVTPDYIVDQAVITAVQAERLNEFTTYIGDPVPSTMLMGDVRNGLDLSDEFVNARADLRPAFMPYKGTSGHYLFSSLKPEQFRTLGVANACDVDNIERMHAMLHFPSSAALGVNAQRATDFMAEVNGVPHPQFIRRFHNKAGRQYAQAIERTLVDGEDNSQWRP
jgi:thymidylate kinase